MVGGRVGDRSGTDGYEDGEEERRTGAGCWEGEVNFGDVR